MTYDCGACLNEAGAWCLSAHLCKCTRHKYTTAVSTSAVFISTWCFKASVLAQ